MTMTSNVSVPLHPLHSAVLSKLLTALAFFTLQDYLYEETCWEDGVIQASPSSSQTFQDKMAKLLHIELTMHYYTSVTLQQNSRKATTISNFFSLKPETLKLLSVSCILAKLELVLKLYIEASVSD